MIYKNHDYDMINMDKNYTIYLANTPEPFLRMRSGYHLSHQPEFSESPDHNKGFS